MDNDQKLYARRSARNSMKALNIMKTLSKATEEDLKGTSPLSVTYVSNKDAKIVKFDWASVASTTDE